MLHNYQHIHSSQCNKQNFRVTVSTADCWTEWASIKHTSILALCCKTQLSMKVHAKKTLPRNMPTHDATNNMQRTQEARGPHTNKTLQIMHTIVVIVPIVNSAILHSTWFKNHYFDHNRKSLQQSKNSSIAQRL